MLSDLENMVQRHSVKFCSFHISIFITTNRFPPIYVISRGKVCPDLISTLDSNLKERIPGVCIAGRLGAGTRQAWLTQHLTETELSWGWKDDGWCLLGRTAQVIPPCSHRPRPGMPHEYMSVEVRTSEWGHAHLLAVHREYTSCHWQPLNST